MTMTLHDLKAKDITVGVILYSSTHGSEKVLNVEKSIYNHIRVKTNKQEHIFKLNMVVYEIVEVK